MRDAPAPLKAVVGGGVGLVVWAALAATLAHGAPAGIVLAGVVFGAINSLVGVSIVLVYRANRVVNFAQAEFGSVAAVLSIEFVLQLSMNYFLAVFLGLVIATLSGGLLEMSVLRRLRNAPRLIVMVLTIAYLGIVNPRLEHAGLLVNR